MPYGNHAIDLGGIAVNIGTFNIGKTCHQGRKEHLVWQQKIAILREKQTFLNFLANTKDDRQQHCANSLLFLHGKHIDRK